MNKNQTECDVCHQAHPHLCEFQGLPQLIEDERGNELQDNWGVAYICPNCIVRELMRLAPEDWNSIYFRAVHKIINEKGVIDEKY